MPEDLPALATPEALAPHVGCTADTVDQARAQAALEAASGNVRDAAGGRTFVDVDGEVHVPQAVRGVVLAAARRAYQLFGTDGLSAESLDDWRGTVHDSVFDGAELSVAETKRCARYSGLAGGYSVSLAGNEPSTQAGGFRGY